MTAAPRPSAARQDVTVSSTVVVKLVAAVDRAGIARDEFVRAARIDPEWLESDDVRLRRADLFRLCQVALDLTRDPAFGLHWGEWLTSNSFNLISHLLVHASNLHQAVHTLQRFGHLLTDELGIELVEKDEVAELRSNLDPSDQPLPVRRLTDEMAMLGFLRLVQHFAGPTASAAAVCFRYPAPEYRSEYTRLFGGAERFDQAFTGLVFARALLRARSPQKDDDLYTTLSDLAERKLLRIEHGAPYAVRVHQHLVGQRSPHRVAMRQVARRLGLSVRSLHRRLAEEGQSYASLASGAAAERAKRLLSDEGRTIQEAAHALGFTKVGSFHRAFRRWTGTTPGAFRLLGAQRRSRRAG
jgi:AraC-like DNA-binding protein